MEDRVFDCVIVGGGPAGLTAAVYLGSSGKKVIVLNDGAIGGKITESPQVRNIPGFMSISGQDFGEKLYEQALSCGAEYEFDTVSDIYKDNGIIFVVGELNTYRAKTCILAVGTKNRLLGIPALFDGDYITRLPEDYFLGNGIHTCSLCDGIFYKDKIVGVVGGGNGAITEALYLSDICRKVIIFQNLETLTADQSLIDSTSKKENVEIVCGVIPKNYIYSNLGKPTLKGLTVEKNEETKLYIVDGVFLSIGVIPNTEIFRKVALLDSGRFIKTDDKMQTAGFIHGLYACGDCTDGKIKQVTTACGQATIAAKSVIEYIDKL